MRTQVKLAVLIGAVFAVLVIALGYAVYFFQNNYAYVDFFERLETRAKIAAQYNFETDQLDAQELLNLRNTHLAHLENETEYIIELHRDSALTDIAAHHNVPAELLQEISANGEGRYKDGNVFYAGIRYVHTTETFAVIVSAENYYATHHLRFLRNILISSVVLIVIIVVLLSVYFSRHIFDPIRNITDRVKSISTENIHLRVDAVENNKEMDELVNTFNDLLNRIETAFETQKNFISNASHELGTPLTAIIGEADVSLMKDRTTEEYKTSLTNISQQAERLQQITSSLLFLAQTGYRDKAIAFEVLRIDEVIWETKALIDKLNPQNKIVIDISLLPEDPVKLKVNGNRQLLQLAFANIMNNACKYSGNKEVIIHIASSDTHVVVITEDQGIGIPESDMPFIYDPFFRAGNTKMFEGYGIGLPLSRNIVLLHKGQLLVTSVADKGTTVQIKIPRISRYPSAERSANPR